MKIGDFRFGEEDARNISIRTEEEKLRFVRGFLEPRRFRLEDFLNGNRCFVSGGKGTGKTALLKYLQIRAEAEGSTTGFYYFQSSFSHTELQRFKVAVQQGMRIGDELVEDPSFSQREEIPLFWRLFLLSEISRLLKRAQVVEGEAKLFHQSVEILKRIARSEAVGAKYPAIKSFHARLAADPSIEISGGFEKSQVQDFATYLSVSEDSLTKVYLEHTPITLFLDELEVYRGSDDAYELELFAVASLVQAVRDFNERFSMSDIKIIAAVRNEVVQEVALVKNEVHRLVNDLGIKIGWNETIRSGFHPLEKIVLRQIASQDDEIAGDDELAEHHLSAAFNKYFPKNYSLRNALNLTWYRPRDIALLFETAQGIDDGLSKFRANTLRTGVLQDLGERMLEDAKSGLGVKYEPLEIQAFDRILRGGRAVYSREQFSERIRDLADQYNDVAILSDNRWIDLIEDLYRVGVLYSLNTQNQHKNFHFRGDPMPSFSSDFNIGVHQTLLRELSILESE